MKIQINIENKGIYDIIQINYNSVIDMTEISGLNNEGTSKIVGIGKDTLFKFITSLRIIYREIFKIDYPNKNKEIE